MNVHEFLNYRMEKTASKRHVIMDAVADPLMLMAGKKGKTRRSIEASAPAFKKIRNLQKNPKMNLFEKNMASEAVFKQSPFGMRVNRLMTRKPGTTRRRVDAYLKNKLT